MNKIEALMVMVRDGEIVCYCSTRFRFNGYAFQVQGDPSRSWKNFDRDNMAANCNYRIYTEPKREFDIKPFQEVLVRDSNSSLWHPRHYAHISNGGGDVFCVLSNTGCWSQIAPYKGNESKLNTTEDIDNKWTKGDL